MRDMTAALIIKDKKILLVHNTKHNGLRIEPPGGKREQESLEECVTREVREELGLIIEPIKFFGVYKTNSPEGYFKVYIYLSEIKDGSPSLKEPEIISNYNWYSYDEMLELKENLVPNLRSALEQLKPYL